MAEGETESPRPKKCGPYISSVTSQSVNVVIRGVVLFFIGVFLALVLNLLQIQRNVTLFPPDVITSIFSSAWWVPPCCGTASAGGHLAPGEDDKDESEHPNNSFNPCSAHDHRCLQKHMAKIRDRSKMKIVGTPREEPRPVPQGSCQSELHRALERLAASQSRTHEDLFIIPIPNCDRNGNFHPKQCHPALDGQRGKCWCVDRKTGVKLPGGLEPKGELDCHQLADSFQE